jgi:hypothetical protein
MRINLRTNRSKKINSDKLSRISGSAFATAFVLLMLFSLIAATPSASAHTPAWDIPTYAYISVSPNPVGVNQQMFVVMWLDKVLPGALIDNDIRFYNYELTITKPDGTTETMQFPVVSDTTSSQFALFTPTEVEHTLSNSSILDKPSRGQVTTKTTPICQAMQKRL